MKHDIDAFRHASAETSEWIAHYMGDMARFRINPEMSPGQLIDRLPRSGPESGASGTPRKPTAY